MTKRILYLSYDGMTDPLGQSQVLPYLIGLTKKGYQFTLISFEKQERFGKTESVIQQICQDNKIDWHPLSYTKKPPVLSTVKDLKALKRKIRHLHSVNPFVLVHCRSYIPALAGTWMKRKWDVKMIFDMRGFWADERVDGGLWNLKNPLFRAVYGYFKKKEQKFLESADYTISLTHNAKQEIHSWKKVNGQPVPIQVIPCCVDMDLFDPQRIGSEQVFTVMKELNITSGTKVISYIGSIGTWYMLPEMLSFFKRWLNRHPQSVFLFVTNDNAGFIESEALRAGLSKMNIRLVTATRKEVPLYIACSDYSIFFIKPAYSKKATSPTKQAEIMAMGKPVICNKGVGDTDHIVNQCHSGLLVEAFNDEIYDKAIDKLISQAEFSSAAIRDGARQYFSLDEGVRLYEEVYKSVISE